MLIKKLLITLLGAVICNSFLSIPNALAVGDATYVCRCWCKDTILDTVLCFDQQCTDFKYDFGECDPKDTSQTSCHSSHEGNSCQGYSSAGVLSQTAGTLDGCGCTAVPKTSSGSPTAPATAPASALTKPKL